ncbi:protein of unknown function (plasmid) [Streptantibioticus cattleyicolor NRRL 8057 = DSM 46488]|nr:protein of unknown function [Streptantibioticus cattleyicolor NRRL 8057 = DSM 46488]
MPRVLPPAGVNPVMVMREDPVSLECGGEGSAAPREDEAAKRPVSSGLARGIALVHALVTRASRWQLT